MSSPREQLPAGHRQLRPVPDLDGGARRRPRLCLQRAGQAGVVDISLSRDQDNPQLIFESMNSTGRELSQADLIRNFILMGLRAAAPDPSVRAVLAADGGGLRPGGLRHALRRLHASLPDRQDR